MRAAIVGIGNELLLGRIANTNAAWISSRLNGLGMHTTLQINVEDELDEIGAALKLAEQSAEWIFVTGGLGPTEDDRTRAAAAKYFDLDLTEAKDGRDQVRGFYERLNVDYEEHHFRQALIPKASRPLNNELGSAIGFHVTRGKKHFIFMPGIRSEMHKMFADQVEPTLLEHLSGKGRSTLIARVLGVTETVIDKKMTGDLSAHGIASYGLQVAFPEVFVVLYLNSSETAPARAYMQQLFPNILTGFDEETLEQQVFDAFTRQGLRLAIAESCTGGAVASKLLSLPGASAYFESGMVTYSNKAKVQFLNVGRQILDTYGAVSQECALSMASGIRAQCHTDVGVGITGILGPDGGSDDKPVGTVFAGLTKKQNNEPEEQLIRAYAFKRDRLRNRSLVTHHVLHDLLKFVQS